METIEMEKTLFERTIDLVPELGPLRLVATDHALVAVYLEDHRRPRAVVTRVLDARTPHAVLDRAARELAEYVRGERARFSIPLAPMGTRFQLTVWEALSAIPFGETRSYAEQATAIGRPHAARAVGTANALNPLSIVVPCHRVIGKGGDLTGYAGGVGKKKWLLEHERAYSSAHTARHEPRSGECMVLQRVTGSRPGSSTASSPSNRAHTSEMIADPPSAGEPA
jgi:methylated-DNA-[protein]-cysteine S-methyltransferase